MTNNEKAAEGRCFVYRARLPLSSGTLRLVVQAIRSHRAQVGSRWRKLPDVQAVLAVLAVLRCDQRPNDLAAAYGISGHTVCRWLAQVVTRLASQAPASTVSSTTLPAPALRSCYWTAAAFRPTDPATAARPDAAGAPNTRPPTCGC